MKWDGDSAKIGVARVQTGPGNCLPAAAATVQSGDSGPQTSRLRKNEIFTGVNLPDGFILPLVSIDSGAGAPPTSSGDACGARYVRRSFPMEPDLKVTRVKRDPLTRACAVLL